LAGRQVGATSTSPVHVDLSIYNILGQKVCTLVSEKQKAGYYEFEWDASGFASGVYYYYLKAGKFQDVKKMVMLK
jgi:flagellar hook assembly protein FlgD